MGAHAQASDDSIDELTKQHEGFLAKYMHQGLRSETSTSLSDYNKFMARSFAPIKHGDRPGVSKPFAGIENVENAATDDAQRLAVPRLFGTTEQAATMVQTHDSKAVTSVEWEPSTWYTLSDSAKVADKGTENRTAQELHSADSAPIGSMAVFFALITFATIPFFIRRRRLWPSYVFATSDDHRSSRSPALASNALELRPQATSTRDISGIIDTSFSQSRTLDPLPIWDRPHSIEPWLNVEAVDIGHSAATCQDNFRTSGWIQQGSIPFQRQVSPLQRQVSPSNGDTRVQTVRLAKPLDAANDEPGHDEDSDDSQQSVQPEMQESWKEALADPMYEDLRARVEELQRAPSDENAQVSDTSADPMYKDLRARVEELDRREHMRSLPDSAWILMIRGEDGGIGVHSLSNDKDGEGNDTVLLFETFDQAQRFGLLLHAQGFFEAMPKNVDVAKLVAGFAPAARISLECVPKGCQLLPPDQNVDAFDWDPGNTPNERSEEDTLYADTHLRDTKARLEALFE
jgi:hypothetical protein